MNYLKYEHIEIWVRVVFFISQDIYMNLTKKWNRSTYIASVFQIKSKQTCSVISPSYVIWSYPLWKTSNIVLTRPEDSSFSVEVSSASKTSQPNAIAVSPDSGVSWVLLADCSPTSCSSRKNFTSWFSILIKNSSIVSMVHDAIHMHHASLSCTCTSVFRHNIQSGDITKLVKKKSDINQVKTNHAETCFIGLFWMTQWVLSLHLQACIKLPQASTMSINNIYVK